MEDGDETGDAALDHFLIDDVGVVQTGTGSRAFRFVCGQFKCAVQTLRVANQSAGMLRAKLLGEKTGLVLLVVAAGFLLTQIPNRNEVLLKTLVERANMPRSNARKRSAAD